MLYSQSIKVINLKLNQGDIWRISLVLSSLGRIGMSTFAFMQHVKTRLVKISFILNKDMLLTNRLYMIIHEKLCPKLFNRKFMTLNMLALWNKQNIDHACKGHSDLNYWFWEIVAVGEKVNLSVYEVQEHKFKWYKHHNLYESLKKYINIYEIDRYRNINQYGLNKSTACSVLDARLMW